LATGALGAVVLADTRRLADSFAAIDYFEQRNTPFVIAVNCFDNDQRYTVEQVREALDVDGHVPVLLTDARDRMSVKNVLITLVEHVLTMVRSSVPA
ncbi:ATP/GTP-binding protein, partial [Catellatospora coxensis]